MPQSWRKVDASQNDPQRGETDGEKFNRIERLRWILRHTMGAPNAFENRRRELAILEHCQEEDISDADVFLSFRESVEQHGIVRAYLEHTQLMLILGDTMFVHGALRMRVSVGCHRRHLARLGLHRPTLMPTLGAMR